MKNHRLVTPLRIKCINSSRPFSNFDYVDCQFGGLASVRRLFSQARQMNGQTVVLEDIPAEGIIRSENYEIREWHDDYEMLDLKRLSFWNVKFSQVRSVNSKVSRQLLGYAILKRDNVPSLSYDRWHVFESVMLNRWNEQDCLACNKKYSVNIGEKKFEIMGNLYCQQNELNKACAQVSLRSLCSLHLNDTQITYRKINEAAEEAWGPFDKSKGLDSRRIRAVLDKFGIKYNDVDYTVSGDSSDDLPYQKYLYGGIESGAGALLGFRRTGAAVDDDHPGKHIIPFFGHTFNKDTWEHRADLAYFHLGDDTRYLPSETWLGSFIVHDDNFGSNFAIPKRYITSEQAQYVVELLRPKANYGGSEAEAIAIDYLYSFLPYLHSLDNVWLHRLIEHYDRQEVVLRAICLKKLEYMRHLELMRDWLGVSEDKELIKILKEGLSDTLWIIEISIPELFPANQRKLGEIVLNASAEATEYRDFTPFLYCRLPGYYLFLKQIRSGSPDFLPVPSSMISHTRLYRSSPV